MMMVSPHNSTRTIPGSPTPSGVSRASDGLPFHRSPSVSDFQIERIARTMPSKRRSITPVDPSYEEEQIFRDNISRLLATKSKTFSVAGRIPIDPSQLVLFFRSKSGITHSLDFPIDVDHNTPPALDVLIAACRPHQTSDFDYPDRESLFYPPNLPLTASLELSSHPILDAVRNTLFPNLPAGHYLTTVRDKLEVLVSGGCMGPQPRTLRNDGRVATIIVTLPVRFRGGALVVRDPDGNQERYYGRGGKNGDIEWTAFLTECEYEMETVQKGCRISISYAVYLKSLGPSGPDTLINPSDNFLDLLSPILNMSRGRKIAFYITNDYGVNPSEVLAESLVPSLKGEDSLLYHAIKLYKLCPELHWSAGGYIWPVDRTVEILADDLIGRPKADSGGFRGVPPMRGTFGVYPDVVEEADSLRSRVEESGATPLAEADISILTDWNVPVPVMGKERVPFVSGGELEKLVVNVLLVVFVP